MKFCSLFSGSSGNSLFISEKQTRILCDAGKNGKQVELALERIGESAEDLDAIIITHEHIDHIAAAGILSRRYNLPIYANLETWDSMLACGKLGKVKLENQRIFETYSDFAIKDLRINSFKTSHDAVEPVGFVIENGKKKIGIATDTGIVTPDMDYFLKGCDLAVLESNHDRNMLAVGSYPYHLKRRISGHKGHLANKDAAQFAVDLVQSGTQNLVMAHLSHENNMPSLVMSELKAAFTEKDIRMNKDAQVEVAMRNTVGKLYLV